MDPGIPVWEGGGANPIGGSRGRAGRMPPSGTPNVGAPLNPIGVHRRLIQALSAKMHAKTKELGPVGEGAGGASRSTNVLNYKMSIVYDLV